MSHYFNPRSPCGERHPAVAGSYVDPAYFNPRSPCGERQLLLARRSTSPGISIHAPRVGSDCRSVFSARPIARFQSTLPVWGATCSSRITAPHTNISIHAPRVGSDFTSNAYEAFSRHFNPRSPCGERPRTAHSPEMDSRNFNPRSPCGERPHRTEPLRALRNFNPRSPCGERLVATYPHTARRDISIHAPRVGSDIALFYQLHKSDEFQSTLPVWGATARTVCFRDSGKISIHAPRVGSDMIKQFTPDELEHFNPRSPCGERHLLP